MKKLLLAFAAMAAFGMANADEVTLDFTQNAYGQHVYGTGDDSDYMEDGSSFSDGAVTITANKNAGNGVRFWGAASGQTFRVMNKSGITVSAGGAVITKIVMTGSNNNYFTVDGVNLSSQTWEGSSEEVVLVNSGSGSKTGTIQIKTMVVTFDGDAPVDTRKDAGLSFPEAKYTVAEDEVFTAPELTKATTAAVTYSSDKETVATVDAATGEVTLVGVGSARITATAEANNEYKAGSASYLLTVVKAAPAGSVYYSARGADFTFENPADLKIWTSSDSYGLKGSGYLNSKPNAAEAYAISPVIDLSSVEDAYLNFSQAFNQYKVNNVMISVDEFADGEYAFVMAREEGAETWSVLGAPTAPASFSWNFFENAPMSLKAYEGKKMQFAFFYASTDACAGTWEVQEIYVSGTKKGSSIEAVAAEDANAPVEYFNLQGVRVANPENGLYIRRQGNSVSKVIVK